MSRLLKYQLDHMETRLRRIAGEKVAALCSQRDKEVSAVPAPHYYTQQDAIRYIANKGQFTRKPSKKDVTFVSSYHRIDGKATSGIDALALCDLGKANKQLKKEYEKDCNAIERFYDRRIRKVHAKKDATYDKLVLAGSEEFEAALKAFEKESF